MATKKCPLTYRVQKGAYDQSMGETSFCDEDLCAWWIEGEDKCARVVEAEALLHISNHSKFQ